jgi:YihY family inner membrane protein
MSLSDRLHALDRRQQRRPWLSFVAAVVKKFNDDQAGQLAALMAYYGFVSLFPLLLVFVTVLGFVVQGNPGEQAKILNGTLGQFPIIRDPIKLHSLSGSAPALVIGIVGSLLAGVGVTNAAQNAFDRVWHVPFKHRPSFLRARLRGLGLLCVLGVLNILSTVAAGFVGASTHGVLAVIGGILVALAVNLLLFFAAFRMLTGAEVQTRELIPGVITGAVLWQLLQHLGGFYAEKAAHQSELYGVFGLVLGFVAWLYVGAQFTLFAAEINVVRARRLWPRSFFAAPLTDADKRALTSSAEVEERIEQEDVGVSFDEPDAGLPGGGAQAS